MRNVSNGFKSAINEFGKQISARITLSNGTVFNSNSIITCKLSYDGALFDAVMRTAEIVLYADAVLPVDDITSIEFGVLVGDAFEYINYGSFVITEQIYNDENDTVEIQAYDPMVKAMVDYNLNLDYSSGTVTVYTLLSSICNTLDIQLGTSSFYNSTQIVDGEKYDDGTYTYRSVLAEIAQVAGGTIAFKPDGILYVLYPNNTGETISCENLRSFKIGDTFGAVNSIVIARTPQEDNIYIRDEEAIDRDGLCEIKIENNQIMDSHREDFLQGLSSALMGLSYTVYDMSSFGFGYFDLLDRFTLIRLSGESVSVLVLKNGLNIGQGLEETFGCEIPEETETDYQYASTTDRVVNQTILRVDKQAQQINAYIQRTDSLEGSVDRVNQQITNISSVMMDAESVNIAISTAIGNIDSITTSTGYTFNADGMTVSKQGEEMSTTVDNTGMYVKQNGQNVLTANNSGVDAINIKVNQYLVIGDNSRLEDYMSDRTACFYIGGEQ